MPKARPMPSGTCDDEKATDPQETAGSSPNVIDAAVDLVETAVTYARQEVGDLVHDKAVIPLQTAGATVALALAIATTVVLGIVFLSAGALILLAQWIGWPYALFAVGGVLILVSVIIAVIRLRSVQK
ncbi:MAG: hypothetical protein FWE94_00110 [Coriobacteriia bacterium]|nr:hypothetical protein [Coriobacteriia bacterium]